MKRYEEYKDSGIEWLGEIPSHWDVDFLKNNYSFEKGKNAGKYTKEYIAEIKGEFPVYSGQTENEGVMGKINTFEYDVDECIFSTTVGAKAMTPMFLQGKFTLSQNCLIMNPRSQKVFSKYIYYILIPLFNYEKGSIPSYMQPSLRIEDLKRFKTVIPTLQEQQQIASYLDYKTSKMDELIFKKEELVETLKNARQKLISETVTKGLDKDVKMKDSGVEWIGEIPEHWEVKRGRYIIDVLSRKVQDTDEIITCFRDGEVTLRKNRREEGFTISDKEIGYQGIEPGDLVIHGMDGFAGAIGISNSRGKSSPVLVVCDSSEDKEYIMYFLRNMAYNNIFLALSTGIRVRSCDLSWNKLKNLFYPIPPIEEQKQIATFIKDKISKIDELISKTEEQIEILKKAKQSLITEVVTGKIDVRGWTK